MIGVKPQQEIEIYPAGVYAARCKGVTVENKQADQYHSEAYQQLRWAWELKIPGRKELVQYSTWTSLSLNPKSHLPGLLAALDVPIRIDANGEEGFDETEVVGKQCQLVVKVEPKATGGTKNKTTDYFAKASAGNGKPKPAPAAAATTPAPVAAPEPAPDLDEDLPLDPFDNGLMDGEAF